MLARLSPLLALGALACVDAHAAPVDAPLPDTATPDAGLVADGGVDAPPPARPALASCLAGGGSLVELTTVDNSDTTEHGALLDLAITGSDLVAVAAEDGTLKLWTLDAELVGSFSGAILTYGPEIPSAPITDLAIDGADVVAGDVRGIVLRMSAPDGLFPIGGTTPEIPIRAVAWAEGRGWLAHAQVGDVAPLTLRRDDATFELTTALDVRDLMFEADGSLLVAGGRGGVAVIERRGVTSPDVATDALVTELEGPFLEIATSRLGLVGVTASAVAWPGASAPIANLRSIAVAEGEGGSFAIVAGEAGVQIVEIAGGRSSLGPALTGAVRVRIDAAGRVAVVGTVDGLVHVLGCE